MQFFPRLGQLALGCLSFFIPDSKATTESITLALGFLGALLPGYTRRCHLIMVLGIDVPIGLTHTTVH
jgi:hypothetical protein